ncbi:MAG: response regulator [Planctomycetota bacterium]
MKKILIADDSLFMRKILKDTLSALYEVIEADSGAKALEQFEKEKPDFVLLDIVMPESEEEGVRVLKEIIKTKPQTPVVMITAVGQDRVIEKCKNLGAKDYIVKPFDENEVLSIVEEHLKQGANYA